VSDSPRLTWTEVTAMSAGQLAEAHAVSDAIAKIRKHEAKEK